MLNYLPTYLKKSKVFQEIITSELSEFERLEIELDDFRQQSSIDTATWALELYEKELKIPTALQKSYEDRRAVIKAKLQANGKLDHLILENVTSAILKTKISVSFNGRIVFNIEKNQGYEDSNLPMFHQIIDDIKPAHLRTILNIQSELDMNLYAGGFISEYKQAHIEPVQFNMPDIKGQQYFGGYISSWNRTTIHAEVSANG
ncbi:putative phage tail protein [Bacillus infantis]|uniref:putative phage tail protein n=1 Tax=Bacillus infantis TaxID=324767 RepID=UPI003CFA3A4E